MNPTRIQIAPGILLDITIRCPQCGDREGMDGHASGLCVCCRCTCPDDLADFCDC